MFLESMMSFKALPSVPRATLADQVHRALLDAIVRGDLVAGQRLHDQEWARQWNISRTPVREAFQYLGREGLVEAAAARYTKLSAFTSESASHEAREWALVHAALADVVVPPANELLIGRLRQAHGQYQRSPRDAQPAAAFEFFGALRKAVPNFGLRLGASAAAYRFRLAASQLPDRALADAVLQRSVIAALCEKDSHAFRRAFDHWLTAPSERPLADNT
jgi:DNA-binding GntR family transcriptional regulator